MLVDLLAPKRKTRVVEVGANPINDCPYGFLLELGHCEVWGFEPEESAFAKLVQSENETYLPYAVGNGDTETFHVCRSISLSSLLAPDQRTTQFLEQLSRPTTVEKEIEMKTVRIDDLEDIPEFDLLKIDVQGGEIKVYEGAQQRLKSVAAIISEVAFIPLYQDQPLLDAQMGFLRNLGMDFHKFLFLKGFALRGGIGTALNKKRGHRNQLLDGDAVFIRSLRTPDLVETEKLKHLAILADTVFQSYDVAARCLQLLIDRREIDEVAALGYVALLPNQKIGQSAIN